MEYFLFSSFQFNLLNTLNSILFPLEGRNEMNEINARARGKCTVQSAGVDSTYKVPAGVTKFGNFYIRLSFLNTRVIFHGMSSLHKFFHNKVITKLTIQKKIE